MVYKIFRGRASAHDLTNPLHEILDRPLRNGHLVKDVTYGNGNVINRRCACAARVTVLGLCVWVSVTQHLTFHVIIRATNDTKLLSGG